MNPLHLFSCILVRIFDCSLYPKLQHYMCNVCRLAEATLLAPSLCSSFARSGRQAQDLTSDPLLFYIPVLVQKSTT